MARPARITSTRLHVPTLLMVGASPTLALRCHAAAQSSGIVVRVCAVEDVANEVSTRQPLAVLLPNEVFLRDPLEYEDLCRDVRATLLPVDDEVSEREIEAMVAGAIVTCLRWREGAGRYAMVDGEGQSAPLTRRSTRPPRSTPSGERALHVHIPSLPCAPANEAAPSGALNGAMAARVALESAALGREVDALFADLAQVDAAPSERFAPPRSGTRPKLSLDLETLFEELGYPSAPR